ncbi:MAG TPA: DUF2231 domain-containing protein [Methylococcaceae bacterium]|nr:DUF2231 domain-containing protein [Methylococcaceae bacterium]
MMDFIPQFFPGLGAIANIHPLMVHFPIALLCTFFVLELLAIFSRKNENLEIASVWLLYLGTLGAFAAVAAGLWAEATVPHADELHAVIEKHEKFGFAVLSIAIVLSVWRLTNSGYFSRPGRIVFRLLAFVMVLTMVLGADLGGLLVYRYGVATWTGETQAGRQHHDVAGMHGHDAENAFMEAGHRHD